MEQNISKEVQDRLNKINWESLKPFGITQESVMQNPTVAGQLAYGQYTDLFPASNEEFVGMVSLHAYMPKDSDMMTVKVYTMDKPKSEKDDLFIYGRPLTSESAKKALFERTSWAGNDGQTRWGPANANAGKPITLEVKGVKQDYLVSIHQPTNRLVAMPVEQVKLLFMNKEGESRGNGMYGVTFSQEQIDALCDGKAIRLDGCKTKTGETFNCYVQFDVAMRQAVPCHPGWLKEAQRTGTDLGLGKEAEVKHVEKTTESESVKKSGGPKVH